MLDRIAKIIAIGLGVIIIVLLAVLIFVNPPRADHGGAAAAPGAGSGAGGGAAQGGQDGAGAPVATTPALSADRRLEVDAPRAGALVVSPLVVAGTVTGGGWFFEASFPVKVLDAQGNILGQGVARASTDWMSAGAVPWSASIAFEAPNSATGTVVFMKDNPSGAPENAGELRLPVRFE